MKRSAVGLVVGIVATSLLAACGSSGSQGNSASSPPVVSVHTATGNMASGLNAPYFVAVAKGYFKQQGIDPSIVELAGTESSTAMVSNSVQVSYSGSSAANAAVQGVPVKVIASISNISSSLIYTADPSVKTLADIEGKTFGVQALGDSYQEALDLAFAAAGLDVAKVQVVPLGAGNRVKAIASGRVAAGALKASEAQAMIKAGYKLRLLYSLPAHHIAQSTGGIATSDAFLTKDNGVLERYLYAWLQGLRYLQKFPAKATSITLKAPQMAATGMSSSELEASIKQFYVDSPLPYDLAIPANVQTKLLAAKKEFLPNVEPGVTTADVYSFTAIEEAERKLNASGWKPTA